MNNFEELKKAALAVLELNDVKGCWQSSLLETKDRGAVHAIVTEHGDNVCEATGDTVIDSVIIDYIESVSPTATLALIAQLEAKNIRADACVNAFEGIETERFAGKSIGEFLTGEVRLNKAEPKPDGSFGFTFSGVAIQIMAEAFADQFKSSGAVNYLELLFDHSEVGPLTVTMQRVDGLTPAQKLATVEAALSAANEKLNQVITDDWNEIGPTYPAHYTPVIVAMNGVTQYITYQIEEGDNGDYWQPVCNEDGEGAPITQFQHWKPLPADFVVEGNADAE
ncbi:DUF551 domain-containing protein [Yersinia mollaretii]|uniref:DUF551 domain-containing protein n=1 Tax=Yersinia mollaretii TaxID=33060 RepID=UPI0011AA171E|nr:DUF551 domain-containing protein [Yersinia mollaretii]